MAESPDKIENFTKNDIKELINDLKTFITKKQVYLVGSYRRERNKLNDLDILVIDIPIKTIVDYLQKKNYLIIKISGGEHSQFYMIRHPKWNYMIQLDLFHAKKENIIPALLHHTGSKEFNIIIRKKAQEKGFKLNQYGLFKHDNLLKREIPIELKTEKDLFKKLGINYYSPKDREYK